MAKKKTTKKKSTKRAAKKRTAKKKAAKRRPAKKKGVEEKPFTTHIERYEPRTTCSKCGSAKRSEYFNAREVAYAGEIDGFAYTHIVTRRTRCLKCSQVREDRSYENRSAAVS